MILLIDGIPAEMKAGSSFEYHSDNRLFHDRDDYSLSIELPVRGCWNNRKIFKNIERKDVDLDKIFYDAQIIMPGLVKSGAVAVTSVTDDTIKVQFLENRSFQNFYPAFDTTFVDELEMPCTQPLPVDTPPWLCWAQKAVIALPWVNADTGNIQNRAERKNGTWQWHTAADDDDDTEVVHALSPQIRLYQLVHLVCSALGYEFQDTQWRASELYHLYSFNCVPAVWGTLWWNKTLPHWTVNEFFENIERFLGGEFDFDHKGKRIAFSFSSEKCVKAGAVELKEIVDEFSAEVSKGDESGYRLERGIGYESNGSSLWPAFSCRWFLKNFRGSQVAFPNLQALVDSLTRNKIWEGIQRNHALASDCTVYTAEDTGQKYMLHRIGRCKADGPSDYQYMYKIIPMNIFGDRVPDGNDGDSVETLQVTPCRIDSTFVDGKEDFKGFLPFVQINKPNNAAQGDDRIHGRRPNATTVDKSVTLKSWLTKTLETGETKASALFDRIQVAFWFGDFDAFGDHMPYPFLDRYEIVTDYKKDGHGHWAIKGWSVIDSGHEASLRINGDTVGLGARLRGIARIDPRKKYEFSFLSRTLPNVRAQFVIRGKRYLCSQIKATINENGMSLLKKGTFYRIADD